MKLNISGGTPSHAVARVALVNPEPNEFVNGAYQVTECADEGFYFDISITNGVSKGPGVTCVITVRTEDGSAQGRSLVHMSETGLESCSSLLSWK